MTDKKVSASRQPCDLKATIRKVGEIGMTLEAGKEMDRQCVMNWLNEVYVTPSRAFNKYTDDKLKMFAHDALVLLNEQEAKQYNNHEVACIIADLFGDPCACNFNDIDTWLPYKCDFRETCCPNPVGVACWEQYLKHKEGR